MIDLRPHILKYQVSTEGYEDENGNYTPGKVEFVGDMPCRAVKNEKEAKIDFKDGDFFVPSFTIYLDLGEREFKAGETIQVFDRSGRKLLEKPIHGEPYVKQLHIKLYV